MCPDFEREERELKKNLAPQEVIPGTQKADASKTVKTFHRSAAGNEEPLPEDLRTPDALVRTLDYLVDRVIGEDQTLKSCHGFVRDRTRSIRQDFTIQNIRDQHTVAACERIARFHIVSLHILCGHKDFAEQQDMEQLRNTLKTLIELYDDHRKVGAACPNEAEFYAYYIRVAERLPASIFLAPIVQQALRLHMLSESSNVVTSRQDPGNCLRRRTLASPQTPLLLACLAEYRFPSIRRAALKAMNTAFPYQEGKSIRSRSLPPCLPLTRHRRPNRVVGRRGAQPIAKRAKQHSEVAVTLANDIASLSSTTPVPLLHTRNPTDV
ncbi:SAC3/GANP/Nin1/mts3/eIF-3 p25 family-domain-containing protein [Kickxella alabastrina]|uniref:SAC3/GANP/Nin1/mts3/eIF-3 p25 family-domain-containing protein n=1 Tax=Kickxella alabastrina TaxID=61397 RepID=UPI002220BAD7|nr:SAC3/GANP/Nin1/mts3/eIF-3 p25 family-domain-containing protein [Kickxella alabastrina]KAI7831007.1 SAC3/GANP/Nin1/mts3/eIF-3 p25 family-domain-containing protein [Kickxella alabastrina]